MINKARTCVSSVCMSTVLELFENMTRRCLQKSHDSSPEEEFRRNYHEPEGVSRIQNIQVMLADLLYSRCPSAPRTIG